MDVNGFSERLGIELPIVQAGMGGGLSGHRLAAAVSEAGGLGTIGILGPDELRVEIAAARGLTERPVAANLLLPFARRSHWEAARAADVVVTFWGRPVRRTEGPWIHQVGSVEEAVAAHRAGADAVIAQGIEAGGHVRGTTPAIQLLAEVRRVLPDSYPVLSAGGVCRRADAEARLAEGAAAVVSGTRFLLTDESGAHPEYKRRLLAAQGTVMTELFGAGWPAPHRVVANAATERWLRGDPRGPAWIRAFHRATAPMLSRMPVAVQAKAAARQSPSRPIFGPVAATIDGPATLVDAGPLYAGECVTAIETLRPAAELTRELGAG